MHDETNDNRVTVIQASILKKTKEHQIWVSLIQSFIEMRANIQTNKQTTKQTNKQIFQTFSIILDEKSPVGRPFSSRTGCHQKTRVYLI